MGRFWESYDKDIDGNPALLTNERTNERTDKLFVPDAGTGKFPAG